MSHCLALLEILGTSLVVVAGIIVTTAFVVALCGGGRVKNRRG
jgi:hypothetical protein